MEVSKSTGATSSFSSSVLKYDQKNADRISTAPSYTVFLLVLN